MSAFRQSNCFVSTSKLILRDSLSLISTTCSLVSSHSPSFFSFSMKNFLMINNAAKEAYYCFSFSFTPPFCSIYTIRSLSSCSGRFSLSWSSFISAALRISLSEHKRCSIKIGTAVSLYTTSSFLPAP